MNETNRNDRKHETIDILVDPRENGRTGDPAPAPKKAMGTPAAQNPADATRKMNPVPAAAATRKMSAVPPAPGQAQRASAAQPSRTGAPRGGARSAPAHTPLAGGKGEKDARQDIKKGARSTVARALIYIALVVAVSAILSALAIDFANDIFALVKDDVTAQIEVPENASISEVATLLKQNGIIKHPLIFRLYVNFRHRKDTTPLTFKPGTYELKSTLNYDQITNLIKYKSTRDIITITVPEGLTVNETIQLFLDKGLGTREGFIAAINDYPYEYTFMEHLNAITFSEARHYRLEGYLFPDTYDFYTDSSEVVIIDKMLAAFEAHFEKAYYDRLTELNKNLDEVVILASIVQMEGRTEKDFYSIAGVFYNRMENPAWFPYLGSDATIQYIIQDHRELTNEDLNIDDPYNTRLYKGLPPGPISNPGWAAIQAALYPDRYDGSGEGEENKYFYFIANKSGVTYFAHNEAERDRIKAQIDKE